MIVDNKFHKQYDPLIRHILKNDLNIPIQQVDDFVTEVYERLLRAPSYDEERGPFTTWLKWIIRSVVSHRIDKENRSEDVLDNTPTTLEAAHNVIGAEDAGTAEDELTRLLDHAMRQNLVHARDVRILKDKHLGGYTAEELAKRYDLEVSTIYSILRDTMQALRECAAG